MVLLGGLLCLGLPACGKKPSPEPAQAQAEPVSGRPARPPAKRPPSAAKPPERKPPLRQGQRIVQGVELTPEQRRRLQRNRPGQEEGVVKRDPLAEPLEVLSGRYRSSQDAETRLEIIEQLGGQDDAAAFELLRQAAASERDAEARAAALRALAETARADHLPAARTALNDADAEVRAAAVALLAEIGGEATLPDWQRVLRDPAPEIVELAFEYLEEAPARVQIAAAKTGLGRNEPWITEQALLLLGGISDKAAVEALIPFIDHAESGDLARDGVTFLVGEMFETSAEARQWWQRNRDLLDEELLPKELNP